MSGQPPKRGRGRPPKASFADIQNSMRFAPPQSSNEEVFATEDDMATILQQIHDSENTNMNNRNMNNVVDAKEQEARDAELARQLMNADDTLLQQEAYDAELAKQLAEDDNLLRQGDVNGAQGDDIDKVMEQIQKIEAEEQLRKKGHAFGKKLNLDRIMVQQDLEDAKIRKQAETKMQHAEWRAQKMQQDWEYEEALQQHQEQQRQQQEQILEKEEEYIPEEEEYIPKTREELRQARMKFYSKLLAK